MKLHITVPSIGVFLLSKSACSKRRMYCLTLNINDALVQDLLQIPGVLQFLVDLADDAIRELLLLPLLDLILVPYPALQNMFCFSHGIGLLLQLIRLGFQLRSFLSLVNICIELPWSKLTLETSNSPFVISMIPLSSCSPSNLSWMAFLWFCLASFINAFCRSM